MEIDFLELDLHDAIIDRVSFEFGDCSIEVGLRYYKSSSSKERSVGRIVFIGVAFSSCSMDFLGIINNSRSGNINSWVPAVAGGGAYFYFVDGCLQIKSDEIKFFVEE
ncbi:hypothetical protein [Xanthomonas sp. SI]|uniref:hypothetical protein n=1 Tax=Xanthomonas sp. SI TaxID=2724123 RepID=UPI00163A8812|nr:hypothetical protein [Xanthomonas sp. SI]